MSPRRATAGPAGSDHLSPSELKELILSYADVFAIEIGNTEVVHHTTDTGGSPPIQQPLRTPFALCT